MEIIWDQIKEQLLIFLTDLNWRYILIFIILLMGIKNNKEFEWWVLLMEKIKLKIYKTWITGLTIMLIFCISHHLEGDSINAKYISSLLRSFFVVIAFSDIILHQLNSKNNKEKNNIYRQPVC